MPWDRPTLKQLNERISRDFSAHLLDGKSLLARSVLGVLAKVWAGCCHLMHGFLAWSFLQIFVFSCEGFVLRLWGRVFGIPLKEAASSEGIALFTGTPGAEVEEGVIMQDASGVQFSVTALTRADASGAIELPVRAVGEGSAGNLAAGTELSFVSPVAGVVSQGAVGKDGLTGGTDQEQEEDYRARIVLALTKKPHGGSDDDYVEWALEVAGVTRAWVYECWSGLGTVGVCILSDNAVGGPLPDAATVTRAYEHVRAEAPVTARKGLIVFAPEAHAVDYLLSISPDTPAVRAAVTAAITDLHRREAYPGCTLYKSRMDEAVSGAPGEEDHTILTPAASLVMAKGVMPIIRSIKFSGDA